MNENLPDMTCMKCDRKLEEKKTLFTYHGFPLSALLPRCPECGQAYISEEFALGRLAEAEEALEDK